MVSAPLEQGNRRGHDAKGRLIPRRTLGHIAVGTGQARRDAIARSAPHWLSCVKALTTYGPPM